MTTGFIIKVRSTGKFLCAPFAGRCKATTNPALAQRWGQLSAAADTAAAMAAQGLSDFEVIDLSSMTVVGVSKAARSAA